MVMLAIEINLPVAETCWQPPWLTMDIMAIYRGLKQYFILFTSFYYKIIWT